MILKKIIQISAESLNLVILIAMFLPAVTDETNTYSVFNIIIDSFIKADKMNILVYMIYYIPTLMSIIFISILKNRFRYAFSLLSASMGLTVTLLNFILAALSDNFKFLSCQYGIYMILCFEIIEIIICFIGISVGDLSVSENFYHSGFKDITTEIPLNEINIHG